LTHQDWPFNDPPNVAVVTVRQIVREKKPALLVYHDIEDGGWQFLTGGEFSMEDALLVSLENVVALDPSLSELADLPLGWRAVRKSPSDQWQREPSPTQ
jgi:hypothetical protein